ncbi:MAG TPA: peptidylprolyl isomerase [Kiritimatiellia bacterium]|nr:MAG: Peptidyl-prolyl cis-trans isomerase C [Verrucomicrobia bacterium ADurb.Bin070]HQA38116.1 peptidylprolyl isomerase [Kiritimatiellia bacterium]HQQ92049.1 peptidylprolyl isomerase [Kiritimatiellia bacterium]
MRQMSSTIVLLSAMCAIVFCGCGREEASRNALKPVAPPAEMPPDYVVAMVNGTPLSWADMEKRAMGYLKDDVEVNHLVIPTNRMAEAKEHFRRRSIKAFVFKTVMLEEAAKQKIQLAEMDRQEGLRALAVSLKSRNWTTNDFFMKGPMGEAMMRREFEDGLVIDKLLKQKVRDTLKVSDKEIAESVALLKATNQATRVKLDGIRKQLLDGADFADTARTVSQCPSAKNGGDLGEFTRGKMLKDFEQAAFTQEIGVIGPVIETRFGYHVLKVTARTPATEATATTPAVPATVRVSHILLKSVPIDHKRLTDSIVRTKYKAGVDAYFRDLKSKSKIECLIYPDMTF